MINESLQDIDLVAWITTPECSIQSSSALTNIVARFDAAADRVPNLCQIYVERPEESIVPSPFDLLVEM